MKRRTRPNATPDGFGQLIELVKTAGPLGSREMILALEIARPRVRDHRLQLLETALSMFRRFAEEYPSDILPRNMPAGVGLIAVVASVMAFDATEGITFRAEGER